MLLIAVYAVSAYLMRLPEPAETDIIIQRKLTLQKVNEDEKALISAYAWVDQPNNIVRLPIERAMELTLASYQAKQATPQE